MSSSASKSNEVLIDCQGVWKVFGEKAPLAMQAIAQRGLSKSEVLREFDCVVGVSDASLRVQKGEIFCIMGLSGSGKSTLIRMFNRLIDPTGGEIRIKGQNLMQLKAGELRAMRAKHIGMVFQAVALLPHRNVLENAAFGLEVQGMAKLERNRIAAEALAKVGLSEWGHKFPGELSRGMQQRVGLARAIAADPEIILMDEPFSALDPLIRRQLQDEFRQLAKSLGKSAVFITHDLDEAMRIGDRIAIMKDGVIVQTGTAADIVLNPANKYVAEFVAGISHLHLVTAHTVMCPVSDFQVSAPKVDVLSLPRTGPDVDLDGLITLMVEAPEHALGVWSNNALLGIVSSRALLEKRAGKARFRSGWGVMMDYAQTIEAFDARVEDALNWLRDNAGFVFDTARAALDGFYDGTNWLLTAPSPYLMIAIFAVLGLWWVGLRFALLTGLGLYFCSVMGLWPETMNTLALVIASTALSLLVALPVGVWAGYHPQLDKVAEPLLDTLQTLPPYIYLLPAIALLGYGPATSLLATVLVAIAPALRLASLGIRMTPIEYVELGRANGIDPVQMFFKIRLPFAVPSIMAGVNQSLMMAFGMVVIAGIVGSGGLGQTIYEAVRTLNIAKSIDATIAIVILTMVLDRLTQSAGTRKSQGAA